MNPFLRHELYPSEYIDIINSALADQSEIGWMNMFRGYLSKRWHQLASSYFGPDDDPNTIVHRNDGANRVHRVMKTIHTLTTDIWTGRNEALHGANRDSELKRLSIIDSEITKLHSEAHLVLNDDRFYCETSLNRLLKGSLANKRRWLVRVKASRQRKASFLAQQPRITKFFPNASNSSTQQPIPRTAPERAPTRPLSPRNKTTQQLITHFLKERAPNHPSVPIVPPSPSPSTTEIG